MGDIVRATQLLEEAAHSPDRLQDLLVAAGHALGFDHFCVQRSESSGDDKAPFEALPQSLHAFSTMDGKIAYAGVAANENGPGFPPDTLDAPTAAADQLCLDVVDLISKHQITFGASWRFKAEGSTWSVTLARAGERGPISGEELRDLERIMPVAHRALLLLQRLHDTHLRGMFEGLAASQAAALLFRRDGTVGHVTPIAQRLFNIDFRLTDGRLWSAHGPSNGHLEALAEQAKDPDKQSRFSPFLIQRFNDHRPILAQPAVVEAVNIHSMSNARLALFLSTPGQVEMVGEDELQLLFGLSKAEARIARLLAGGLEPQQIAEQRSVSVGTIRVQMKHIFQKMNVHRQGELIRAIADLRPPCRTLVDRDLASATARPF